MRIEGHTIIFSSSPVNWLKEQDGRKPNTTRYIPLHEVHEYMLQMNEPDGIMYAGDSLTEIKNIRIINSVSKQPFERQLTDVTFADINMMPVFIFSWKHEASLLNK